MNRRAASRTARAAHAGASASLVALVLVGCNAILDNQPGVLVEADASATEPPASGSTAEDSGASEPPPVGAGDDAGTVTPDDDAGACEPGKHLCQGVCVSLTDPLYGCGDPGCTPCELAHGSAACQGRTCVIAKCEPGYADCNKKPRDGCETDLSKPTSCGSCNAACPATAPVCGPSGATFACSTGCTAAAPVLCGGDCVDPLTSLNHCGACNNKCPTVANATTTCTGGICTFTCQAGLNACNGMCTAKTDPAACGPTCAICPTPPNATPLCTNDACAFQCAAGFADCNLSPLDGCEAMLATDNANCGICGHACAVGTACKAGACVPTADAAP